MMNLPERRMTSERRATERRISRAITPHLGTPIAEDDPLGFPLNLRQLDAVVRSALQEDGAFNDVTTIACVLSDRRAHGTVLARQSGIIAGVPLAVATFRQLDHDCAIRVDVEDGERVSPGASIMRIAGLARAILSAERVALNFLQRLSGVATLTSRYVDAVRGTRVQILDTRKTTPGLRQLEKYAVRAGGGISHRLDLSTVLIKDNHLNALGGDVEMAVRRTREFAPADARVEVQCESLGQVEAAIKAGADIVLLTGMSPAQIQECVELVGDRAITEASGEVALDSVRSLAQTGVDRISVGALTQGASALGLELEFEAV
jgi:nicotinate-nucleotide pyrophosphorylase (carboxylating)